MKIEMGESLFYSWLRHVKECQIVQTNWKASSQWNLLHEKEIEEIMFQTDAFFENKYGYKIYKKNTSLKQIIQQGECDALGVSFVNGQMKTYAVDVAFHEAGLNYGSKETTVMKIINKCIRTAMCIYGFMDNKKAEIIFASPKIHKSVLQDAQQGIGDAQRILNDMGYHFNFRIIANDDFRNAVLNPILLVSDGVADTNELFLRSYQMLQMFENKEREQKCEIIDSYKDYYLELKIGQLAQVMIREKFEQKKVSAEELLKMQTSEYSKEKFDLQYPVLVNVNKEYDRARYYSKQLEVNGEQYALCSQWFEVPTNNDRPFLLKWIEEHQ